MIFLRKHFFSTINSSSKELIEKEFMKLDFYSILQVKHTATINELRKNYFELAKIFHPDKYNGPTSIFKKICESYNTLKDPNKREDYDKKLKIKQTLKYRSSKSKQKTKNTDFYEGMKSKYEEDFKQLNIERLFGQFISSPIKNAPKNIKVFKPILERKMTKREYKIHVILNEIKKAEMEQQGIAKRIIEGLKNKEEDDEKPKSYEELSKIAVNEIKYDIKAIEKVKFEKEEKEKINKTMLKLEYLFYSAAVLYIISFVYFVLRNKNLQDREKEAKLRQSKMKNEFRQMNYLYPQIPKK